jgi:diguanylate cyclase (GGDEF)-like protein/PAS domain S-box-containing protein
VTERQRAEQRTRTVVDRIAEAISVIGPDGRHLQVNAAAQAILDDLAERFEQRPLGDVAWGTVRSDGTAVPNDRLPAEITRLTGREIDEEVLGFPGARGDVRWLRISTRRLSGERAPYGVIVSFTDVTEQRQTAIRLREAEARYETVVSALHEGVIVYATTGEIVAANPRAEELLGLSEEQLRGRTPLDPRWHSVREDGSPWDPEELPTARALRTGEAQIGEVLGVHTPTGAVTWVQANATPLLGDCGELAGVVTSFVDVTEQRARERALAAAEERFRTLFEAAPIGMSLTNLAGTKIAVNPALAQILGRPAESLVGLPIDEHIHPDDRAASLAAFARLVFGEQLSYRAEERVLDAMGGPLWVQLDATLLRDGAGEPAAVLRQVQDISERRHHEKQLHHLAHHDALTGLLCRGFAIELDRHASHAERYGADGALLLFDLDNFKDVNDRFGHKAGDDLIVAVAEIMRARLRTTDVLARLGGDEFAVLIPHGGLEAAQAVADALLAELRDGRLVPEAADITVTASLGIATFEGRAGAGDILVEADLAMYKAKRSGRDRCAHSTANRSAATTR